MQRKLRRNWSPTFESLESRSALSGVPVLNSLPGAERQLFLDFDGDFRDRWASTGGLFTNIFTPAFDFDGDLANFSDAEGRFIQQVWEHVAEDFRPFQINVTTVQPPSIADGVGLHVAIGGNAAWHSSGSGLWGIAPSINAFYQHVFPNTVFVFSQNILSASPFPIPRYVADTASHEAGHAFGLQHQSSFSGGFLEYNPGNANAAPIMGQSINAKRSIWWNGLNRDRQPQDDVFLLNTDRMPSIINWGHKGLQFRADDHGSAIHNSTPLAPSGATFSAEGIIETNNDLDYFRIQTAGGPLSVSVSVLPSIANLDAAVEIRNTQNQVVVASSPTNSLNASVSTNLPAGTYYIVVRNSGEYGALGKYWVSGSYTIGPPLSEQFALYRNTKFILDSGRPGFEGFETFDQYQFGAANDVPVIGDWDGNGIDEMGVFRPHLGRFYLDTGNRGYEAIEPSYQFGLPTDKPVVGDWNGDGVDDLGVFRPSTGQFILDTGQRGYEGHEITTSTYQFGLSTDTPIVGDWNGDGVDDLGVFRPNPQNPLFGLFILDTGPRGYDGTEVTQSSYSFGLASDRPIVGDWNGDRIDDLGVYRPEFGNFYLDTGPRGFDGPEDDPQNTYQFGLASDVPLVGRWGTSVTATALPPAPYLQGIQVTPVFGETAAVGDLNDDGRLDVRDFVLLRDNFGRTNTDLLSDVDASGVVDRRDVVALLEQYRDFTISPTSTTVASPSSIERHTGARSEATTESYGRLSTTIKRQSSRMEATRAIDTIWGQEVLSEDAINGASVRRIAARR